MASEERFVAVEEPSATGGTGDLPQNVASSFDSDEGRGKAKTFGKKTSPNRRLGSMRKESSDDGGSAKTSYYDGDLKDADVLPMEDQDGEHDWEALNARILERMNEEHKWMVKHKIIHPMGPFRKRWDAVQVVLLAYVAMLVPCEYRPALPSSVPTPCPASTPSRHQAHRLERWPRRSHLL